MGAVKAMRPAMADTDAPPVEPLALTLEEALEAVRMVEPHTYHLTLYGKQWKVEEDKRRAVREVVDRDESWPALLSRFFGHPVERRDDTAELAEAAERYLRAIDTAKQRRYEHLLATTTAEVQAARDAQGVASREAQGARKALEAALARVRSEP